MSSRSMSLSLAMSIRYCRVWFRNVVSVTSSGLSCQYQTFMPWLVLYVSMALRFSAGW